jgi:ketosteroid isomerase-like protein
MRVVNSGRSFVGLVFLREACQNVPRYQGKKKAGSDMSDMGLEEGRNIDIVRHLFDAFTTHDVDTLKSAFTIDALFRRIAIGPLQDDFRGPQAIVDFFADLSRETNGTLRLAPLTITASGARVLVLYQITATRNGKALDTNHVLVFTLASGAITEAVMFASDFMAQADFWA